MKKFNLRKNANAEQLIISDKGLEKNRNEMNLSNGQQGVIDKNINFSLPIKDKDNTIPFNQQLEASRKNETTVAIIEDRMDDKIVDFSCKDKKQVTDINVETQKYMSEKSEKYKKAEQDSKKDTVFWDKYVGDQLEGQMKNVDNNIPESASQLQNISNRFKGKKINKMVMASIKDADAMLFHIYAIATKENRELTTQEHQQITDINSGKIRLLALNTVDPIKRSLEHSSDPIIKEELGGRAGVYEEDGTKIDEFKSCKDARANYPEGELRNE